MRRAQIATASELGNYPALGSPEFGLSLGFKESERNEQHVVSFAPSLRVSQ